MGRGVQDEQSYTGETLPSGECFAPDQEETGR